MEVGTYALLRENFDCGYCLATGVSPARMTRFPYGLVHS